MGVNANILKHNAESFSSGGISENYNDVCIVNANGPFDPNETHPAVLIVRGPGGNGHVIAVPAEKNKSGKWVESKGKGSRMFGGTFINASDSRFHDLVESLGGLRGTAIGFHDRFETGR
jgi:hypothetical protein